MVFHAWGCTLNGREGNKEDMKKNERRWDIFSEKGLKVTEMREYQCRTLET